ncbi:hypothetical protein Tco_0030800 [Tanacetum coccineum]
MGTQQKAESPKVRLVYTDSHNDLKLSMMNWQSEFTVTKKRALTARIQLGLGYGTYNQMLQVLDDMRKRMTRLGRTSDDISVLKYGKYDAQPQSPRLSSGASRILNWHRNHVNSGSGHVNSVTQNKSGSSTEAYDIEVFLIVDILGTFNATGRVDVVLGSVGVFVGWVLGFLTGYGLEECYTGVG